MAYFCLAVTCLTALYMISTISIEKWKSIYIYLTIELQLLFGTYKQTDIQTCRHELPHAAEIGRLHGNTSRAIDLSNGRGKVYVRHDGTIQLKAAKYQFDSLDRSRDAFIDWNREIEAKFVRSEVIDLSRFMRKFDEKEKQTQVPCVGAMPERKENIVKAAKDHVTVYERNKVKKGYRAGVWINYFK